MSNEKNEINFPMLDMDSVKAQQALFEHEQNQLNSNRSPLNGGGDSMAEVRIRTAIIDNYLTERNGESVDPLKTDNVLNMKTGKVVLKWINYSGGIVKPERYGYPSEGFNEPWTYYPQKDSKYPEKRTLDCYNHDSASDREMVDLTHAFIWNNGSNWCGMNYLPPIGSIVLVGFKKNNIPVILGFVQSEYSSCKPFLKPGETIIKGYGDNKIHFRWSNKLDIHVKSKKGELDNDDPYKKDTYPNTIDMWMRFDCFTRNLIIDVNQLEENRRSVIEIKPESIMIKNSDSKVVVSEMDVHAVVGNNGVIVNNDLCKLSHGSSSIQVSNNNVNIKAAKINIDGDINLSGNNLNVNSSSVKFSSGSLNLAVTGPLSMSSASTNIDSSGVLRFAGSTASVFGTSGLNLSGASININT